MDKSIDYLTGFLYNRSKITAVYIVEAEVWEEL
jgi:hypothetical protein